MGKFPGIANFLDKRASEFPLLQTEWKQGQPPVLKLYSETGEEEEEISITSWKEDSIASYLKKRLVNGGQRVQSDVKDEL